MQAVGRRDDFRTAAAVIQNPLATMLVDDLLETGCPADGGVPVDGLIGAVFRRRIGVVSRLRLFW